jgi:DedD protein
VLPLLLEDEPPPASSLAVHMAVAPKPEPVTQPIQKPEPVAPAEPVPAAPVEPVTQPEPVKPEPKIEPAKPAPKPKPQPAPAKPEPVKPKPAPAPQSAPAPEVKTKPADAQETYVVQLAALSDADKAQALKARVTKLGLPAYTDALGSLTRVRVGPFNTRTAAVAAAVKLAENGMSGQVLTK